MSERDTRPTSDGDLEYDLAHLEGHDHEEVEHPEPVHESVYVATETESYADGDYGYDLAHDVPGR